MSSLLPNTFAPHINKATIQELPLTFFEGEVIIVDKPDMVADAAAYLCQHAVLGVDTEARPSFKRGVHYPTALVQISTLDRCYLFRLTHVGLPVEIAAIFANPDICKVGLHSKMILTDYAEGATSNLPTALICNLSYANMELWN